MEIKHASLYVAKLALKKPFKHGSFERTHNDTIFLQLKGENSVGYGESLPREYVTGETPEQVIENLKKYVSKLSSKEFKSLEDISIFLNECEPLESRNMASLCGLDMALLDLYGKNKMKSISEVLCYELGYKVNQEPKVTSGPIGLSTPEWKKNFYCAAGINDIKLKITPETDPEKIYRFRNKFIRPRSLRLDGNCSLTPDQLASLLIRARSKIDYIEQPFPVGKEKQLAGIKFLADESLVSVEDAKKINFDAASIRVGKNGGILRTLDIIKEWEKRGKEYMIGSLVGETSLLSSAALHISRITSPFLNECCYSTRLLKSDPTDVHPFVTYKGKVKFDYSKLGLGANLYLFDKDVEEIKLL